MNFYAVSPHSEVVTFLNNFGTPISSCGRRMRPLASGSGGGSPEVHVPILSINGNEVTVHVGTQPHPMLSVHYIQWIVLECANSRQCRFLVPGQEPKATFLLTDGDQVRLLQYTRILGLSAVEWMATCLFYGSPCRSPADMLP